MFGRYRRRDVAKHYLDSERAVALTFGNFYSYGNTFWRRSDVRRYDVRTAQDE